MDVNCNLNWYTSVFNCKEVIQDKFYLMSKFIKLISQDLHPVFGIVFYSKHKNHCNYVLLKWNIKTKNDELLFTIQ